MVETIKITYRDGAYRVSQPNWDGGDVVMAADYAELEAENARLTFANNTLTAAAMIAAERAEKAEALSRTGAVKDAEAARDALRELANTKMDLSIEDWCRISNTILSALEPAAPEGHHPDDIAVDRFAAAMKEKLARKREEGRGGWDDKEKCSGEYLSRLLREHVDKGDPVDVGNLAMMLHQRGERIAPEGQQDDDRIRREMDEILRKQSERDIPFAPATRPSEQAVTEAMIEAAQAKLRKLGWAYNSDHVRAALKAAMEAGR